MAGLAVAEAAFIVLTEWIFSGLDPSADRRFSAGPRDVLLLGPILIVGLGVAQAGFFYGQAITAQGTALRTLRDLQNAMFRKIGTFDLAQTADDGSGQLVSRFTNDMVILREGLTRAPNGVRDLIRLIVLVGVLAYQDWVLFVSVLLIYPTVGLPVTWLGGRIRRMGRAVQAQIGDMTGLLSEILRHQQMVKTYRLEEREQARLGSAFEERYRLLRKLVGIRSANEPIITVVGALAIAAIIAIGAMRINAGLLTGPELVSFLIGMAMLSQPARGLGTLNAVLQESFAALERVYDVLDRTPTILEPEKPVALPSAEGAGLPVAFDEVCFAYTDGDAVLDSISFEVEAGSTVAIVGPSGAGKSSLFALIPRLYDVDSGSVLVGGKLVKDLSLASLRTAIAHVSQHAVLFDETIADNIRYGRENASDEDVRQAAQAAAAHEFITDLPKGYNTRVGEGGDNLSGGQRARIAIARAFLKDAPILLLDEATAALDAKSEQLIDEALKRLARGRTTLIIAHRLSTVRDVDRIFVMDRGGIVEAGTHDALLAKGGLYASLCAVQFGQGVTATEPEAAEATQS